jgi:predicted dehydrogenase
MPSNSSGALRIAVIGAGFISDYHVNGLRAAGGAEVAILVGRDRGRTEARAAELGIAGVALDYRVVLDDAAIDAVVIATPDHTHRQIAIDALMAGKPVLLQKPMARDAGECREIIAAAERSGTRLTVSFMHRYFPEVLWLQEQLAGGRLGQIQGVRLRNATPGADWAEWLYTAGAVAGGVVMQLGVHGIDLCQHLFGPIAELSATKACRKPLRHLADGREIISALEDTANAIYEFAAGFGGSHEMSYSEAAGTDRFRLEVYTDKATVWLRSERGAAALFAPEVTGVPGWVVPELGDDAFGAVHHRTWLKGVRGEAPPDDTASAGISSIIVAEAIYAAARGRRGVAIAAGAESGR